MKTKDPSPTETEILHSLWSRSKATVRDVHDDISATRPVGYTTILKQMQRMENNGLIRKTDDAKRAHVYTAVVGAKKVRSKLIDNLVKNAFGGRPNQMILHALGQKKLSAEDIASIRGLLDDIEKEG